MPAAPEPHSGASPPPDPPANSDASTIPPDGPPQPVLMHTEGAVEAHGVLSPPARPFPPELEGHPTYEVLGLLGQGGMGAVYKARHRPMHRLVALKVLAPHLLDSARAVERFQR